MDYNKNRNQRKTNSGKRYRYVYDGYKSSQRDPKKTQLDPKQVDMVIVATITPDMHVSATAAHVATEIGATNAFGYDLQAYVLVSFMVCLLHHLTLNQGAIKKSY